MRVFIPFEVKEYKGCGYWVSEKGISFGEAVYTETSYLKWHAWYYHQEQVDEILIPFGSGPYNVLINEAAGRAMMPELVHAVTDLARATHHAMLHMPPDAFRTFLTEHVAALFSRLAAISVMILALEKSNRRLAERLLEEQKQEA